MTGRAVVAVDVGTGSARAGVISLDGTMLAKSTHPILLNQPITDHAEHSSDDIWQAVCNAVRDAVRDAQIDPSMIEAISFDATCSLVALDAQGLPVSISLDPDVDREIVWDTIVWMDHRAVGEAEECTASGHEVLRFIGGVMSPEMQIPKIMWMKRNLKDRWNHIHMLFDLADYLTFRASGNAARSACTLTCKWTYLGHEETSWHQDFLDQRGLEDFRVRSGAPEKAVDLGHDLGTLSGEAARALGLSAHCRVAAGAIDAHAGAIGVLGAIGAHGGSLDQHIGLIAGTSTCLMAMSEKPREIDGVWGPYWAAAMPGAWLNEGGQSVTGALLDHVLSLHGAGRTLGDRAHAQVIAWIEEQGEEWRQQAWRLHVLPDFHGNRSPLADPHALGVISGLSMRDDFESLCSLYYRTAVGIALGTRHIIDAMNNRGYNINSLHVTGGHTKNPVLMRLYADLTACRVVTSKEEDAVLLGTAMLAATACGAFPSLTEAAAGMAAEGGCIEADPSVRAAADRDYEAFLSMHRHRADLDRIVS